MNINSPKRTAALALTLLLTLFATLPSAAWPQNASGDTTAVFFAGHGIEMAGSNYLMPRDVPAAAKGERLLRGSALALAELLQDLDGRKPRTAFVVLDACRNNPFSISGRAIGGARGLARVDERPGTLILYSTGIGLGDLDWLARLKRLRHNQVSVRTFTLDVHRCAEALG